MAVHGGPVSDRDNSGHGHCVDHKIIQKTALGMFIHIYLYVYYLPILVIRKCVQCTLLVQDFLQKFVCLYEGLHTCDLGQSAIQFVFNLCSFMESELCSRP